MLHIYSKLLFLSNYLYQFMTRHGIESLFKWLFLFKPEICLKLSKFPHQQKEKSLKFQHSLSSTVSGNEGTSRVFKRTSCFLWTPYIFHLSYLELIPQPSSDGDHQHTRILFQHLSSHQSHISSWFQMYHQKTFHMILHTASCFRSAFVSVGLG